MDHWHKLTESVAPYIPWVLAAGERRAERMNITELIRTILVGLVVAAITSGVVMYATQAKQEQQIESIKDVIKSELASVKDINQRQDSLITKNNQAITDTNKAIVEMARIQASWTPLIELMADQIRRDQAEAHRRRAGK